MKPTSHTFWPAASASAPGLGKGTISTLSAGVTFVMFASAKVEQRRRLTQINADRIQYQRVTAPFGVQFRLAMNPDHVSPKSAFICVHRRRLRLGLFRQR